MQAAKSISVEQLNEVKSQVKALEQTTNLLANQLNASETEYIREPFFINTVQRLTQFVSSFGENLPEALGNFHYELTEFYIDAADWASFDAKGSNLEPLKINCSIFFLGIFLTQLHPTKRKASSAEACIQNACKVAYEYAGRFDDESFSDLILQTVLFVSAVTYKTEDVGLQQSITAFLFCFR